MVHHLLHARPAGAHQLGDGADVVLGDVDGEALHRLVELAVDLADQHLRLADGQLEALTAHHLHKDGQLELATSLHLPGVRTLGVEHPDRHVADQFGVEAVLHQPCGEEPAHLAGQR